MTPEKPAATGEVGWNAEWRAISGDSLAAAVYSQRQSRVAANAALELGPMLARREIDLVEMEAVMEAARTNAAQANLAVAGAAGRGSDVRGWVKKLIPGELRRIRRPFENESAAEQERRARRYLVETGLVMTECFEPRLGLNPDYRVEQLIPDLVTALKLTGCVNVPAMEGSQSAEGLGALKAYLLEEGKSLGAGEISFGAIPKKGYIFGIDQYVAGEIVYALARHPQVRQKMTSAGKELELGTRLLARALKFQFHRKIVKNGGPHGEDVEVIDEFGRPQGVRQLFPDYPFNSAEYWSAKDFPYGQYSLPREEYGKAVSIYRFHLDRQWPEHMLRATAAEGPEKLRIVLAAGQASKRQLAKELDGATIPELGVESDSRGLGKRLSGLGRKFGEDEEMITWEAMLWRLNDPLEIIKNPGIGALIGFRGDSYLFAPMAKFPIGGDETKLRDFVIDHGDEPRVWICVQIAKKLLPHSGILEQAEKERRIRILPELKLILRLAGEAVEQAAPALKADLDLLRGKYGGREIPLEELVAIYSRHEQSVAAAAQAGGVDLRSTTMAEIRRTGGCPTLPEAVMRLSDQGSRQLAGESLLVDEFSLFSSRNVSFGPEAVTGGWGQILGYHGWCTAGELPDQIVNIRGRPERMTEAMEWLRQQQTQVREYLRYLISYRLLYATVSGLIDWPDKQADFYRDVVSQLHKGRDYPHRYPAVGVLLEYLAGLDVEELSLAPGEVETAMNGFKGLGLEFVEVKYDKWYYSRYEAMQKRADALAAQDRSDWRKNREWLNKFLGVSYAVCQAVMKKLGDEYGIKLK
jgi:hypothetical protein